MKISLHDPAVVDPRPFAYVHVVWEDPNGKQWKEQERWIKHYGKWYTRSTGMIYTENLVTNG